MATATSPVATHYPDRIVQPLVRLRRAIRAYVVAEAIAIGLTLACVWFWTTFLIDWGLFQVFGYDYLRDGAPASRFVLRGLFVLSLIGGIGFIVGYKFLYRWLASFRESALALVFERRFADILGDRLVTAVELADPAMSRKYGYSQIMVEETAQAAAERVHRLPLNQVFNLSRLARWTLLAVMLLGSVVLFSILATDSAAIWMERDLLLQNTYWPRSVMFELPDFPPGTTKKAVPYGGKTRVGIRAWKWVVASHDKETWPEGWRPLVWDDFGSIDRPWELKTLPFSKELLEALPASWRSVPLDQVEVRWEAARTAAAAIDEGQTPTPEGQKYLSELGLAVAERLPQPQGKDRIHRGLLPDAWRELPAEAVIELLEAFRRLTPAEQQRLSAVLKGQEVHSHDAVQWLLSALSPIKPVTVRLGDLQQHVFHAPLLLSDADWAPQGPLPQSWRGLSTQQLLERLDAFREDKFVKQVSEPMLTELEKLFGSLGDCADQSHIGRRRGFRRLEVPKEVKVEFEQVLTEEERRAMGKPKRGEPAVQRLPASNDFAYEFKKVERPLRFRVIAGSTATIWYHIEIVPVPILTELKRFQEEPGYLYGSNAPVRTGPIHVSTEGEESRFEARSGTRVRLEASSSKPLRWVRVTVQGQGEQNLWAKLAAYELLANAQPQALPGLGISLDVAASCLTTGSLESQNPYVERWEHETDSPSFTIWLKEMGQEDMKLSIQFLDTDGIPGSQKLQVAALRDQGPEFVHARFDIVRREMVTMTAVIPFSGRIRDEHGLRDLAYEVRVSRQTEEGQTVPVGETRRFPFRQFVPVRTGPAALKDLSFEGLNQPASGRLSPAARSLRHLAQLYMDEVPSSLLAFPLAGQMLGAYQPPALQIPEEFRFEYAIRTTDETAYDEVFDEYFDMLPLRRQLEALKVDPQMIAPPYKVSISLAARDNYVGKNERGQPVHGIESRSPETFEFNVVDENDLLIDCGRREEDLHDRLTLVVEKLKKAKDKLGRVRKEFDQFKGDDFVKAGDACQEVVETLLDTRESTDREVARELRMIYRELQLNRVRTDVLQKMNFQICLPLEDALAPLGHARHQGQHFAQAHKAVSQVTDDVRKYREKTSVKSIELAIAQTDALIFRLEEVLAQMQRLIEFNQAIEALRELIKAQGGATIKARELAERIKKIELEGAPPSPPKPAPLDFKSLDKNNDGSLSKDELKATPLSDKFDAIDANKDGKIDAKEFEEYLKKNPPKEK